MWPDWRRTKATRGRPSLCAAAAPARPPIAPSKISPQREKTKKRRTCDPRREMLVLASVSRMAERGQTAERGPPLFSPFFSFWRRRRAPLAKTKKKVVREAGSGRARPQPQRIVMHGQRAGGGGRERGGPDVVGVAMKRAELDAYVVMARVVMACIGMALCSYGPTWLRP